MFPLKEQVYERDRKILIDGYGLEGADYDFGQPEKILQRFCERHGILFLPTMQRFGDEASTGKRFHFISDNHFNAAGHALLADEMFAFLLAHRLAQNTPALTTDH